MPKVGIACLLQHCLSDLGHADRAKTGSCRFSDTIVCPVAQWGKVVATAPTPKLTPVNADGSPIKAAAAKAPATGRRL